MSLESLYNWTSSAEEPIMEARLTRRGVLKKKRREEGVIATVGFSEGSDKMFTVFANGGRLLVMFEESPTEASEPKLVLSVKDITGFEEDHQGKKGHVLIKLGEKDLLIKFDSSREKDDWMEPIKFFQAKFAYDGVETSDPLCEEVDALTTIELMTQNMKWLHEKVKMNYDYTGFITDKGLKKLVQENSIENLRNKMFIASFTKEHEDRKDAVKTPESRTPDKKPREEKSEKKGGFSFGFKKQKVYFGLIISQRAIVSIDEDSLSRDTGVLTKQNLPDTLDFNVLHLFKYDGPGDMTPVHKQRLMKDLEFVYVDRDKKTGAFTVRSQFPEKTYTFFMKTAWEAAMVAEAMQNSADIERERLRSKYGLIRFDLDLFYRLFESGAEKKLISALLQPFGESPRSNNAETLVNFVKTSGREIALICDGYYSHKPFVLSFFKYSLLCIHEKVRNEILTGWNKGYETFSPDDTLSIINGVSLYEKVLLDWNIRDDKFKVWLEPMVTTFLSSFFEKSKEVLSNALTLIHTNTQNDAGKIYSRTSDALEKHLFNIFDSYQKIQNINSVKMILEYSSTVMEIFFMNTLAMLRDRERLSLDSTIALLNNRSLKIIKNLQKKITTDTEGAISLKQIKLMLGEENLSRMISEVERLAMKNLEKQLRKGVKEMMDQESEWFELDFPKVAIVIFNSFNDKIIQLESKAAIQNAYFAIGDKMTNCYLKKFIESAQLITPENHAEVVKRIEGHATSFQSFLEGFGVENAEEQAFKLRQMSQFVDSDDIDQIIVTFMNLQVFCKQITEPQNLKNMLKSKTYLPNFAIATIEKFFVKATDDLSQQKEERSKIRQNPSLNPVVFKFISILKKRHLKIKNQAVKKEEPEAPIEPPKTLAMIISQTQQPSFSKIYGARGYSYLVGFEPRVDDQQVEAAIKKILSKNKQMTKIFVTFMPDFLRVAKEGSKIPPEQIIYRSITVVNMMGKNSFYIKTKTNGYAFFLKDFREENAKIWFQYLLLMKDKYNIAKEEPKKIDLTDNLPELKFASKKIKKIFNAQEMSEKLKEENKIRQKKIANLMNVGDSESENASEI